MAAMALRRVTAAPAGPPRPAQRTAGLRPLGTLLCAKAPMRNRGRAAGVITACNNKSETPQPNPLSVPEALLNRANTQLVFPDGTTLPANADLLAIHSPVLAALLDKHALGGAPMGSEFSREAWLAVLKMLYLVGDTPLAWGNILEVCQIVHKYKIERLRPQVVSFMLEADFGTAPPPVAGAQDAVWEWLVAAARCGLSKVVDKCCRHISANRLQVREGYDLGCAAQPLAEYMTRCLAGVRAIHTGRGDCSLQVPS